jgi:hypothetical protein
MYVEIGAVPLFHEREIERKMEQAYIPMVERLLRRK